MKTSPVLSLTLAALLAASPVFAADLSVSGRTSGGFSGTLGSGSASGSANAGVKASGRTSMSTDSALSGAIQDKTSTHVLGTGATGRGHVRSHIRGHGRCGGNSGMGVGNFCDLSFGKIDANTSGDVTLTEAQRVGISSKLFTSLDKDNNHLLTDAEMSAFIARTRH